MEESKIKEFLDELFSVKYTWKSGSSVYDSTAVNKEAKDKVEVIVRKFLLDNRDAKLAQLEAKVFMYEEIIKKSNFAPMLETPPADPK